MFGAKLTTALVIAAAVWPAGAYAITYPAVNPNTPPAQQELRSQDTSPSASTPSASDGITWGEAGIGAAVILGLVTLASATVLVTGRGRGRAAAGPSA
jgi:hypothetical protein